jgi:hypothetical protein
VVHPTNPNIVYVAALGAVWNTNPERGLYKTTDGGQTWTLIKFVSEKAGVVDVAMDPSNPEILYAASWERIRGPYFLQSGGPGSALWKSTDGGATWTELKGSGFPESMKGRIGLAIAASNPQIVYAMVEADTNPNPKPEKGAKAQTSPSGLYRSADAGKSWTKMAPQNVRPFYYSQVRVDPRDADRVYFSSTPRVFSTDGGKTVRSGSQGIHVDSHAHWIDPADPSHQVEGNDGGVWQTWDKGGNWIALNQIPIGQFYNVSYDFGVPYRVCGGLQDNGSWCGADPAPQPDHQRAVAVHQRRRRVRDGAGLEQPQHRLLRVPGRQHAAPQSRHRGSDPAGQAPVAAPVPQVAGLDPHRAGRYHQAGDQGDEGPADRAPRPGHQGLGRPAAALELEHAVLHLGA